MAARGQSGTHRRARIASPPMSRNCVATVRERFIPGTHLIRYGEGDWNDSLQPVDPRMRDWMVSSWTVALLFQQLAATPRFSAGRAAPREAAELSRPRRARCALDFNRISFATAPSRAMRIFAPGGGAPELLLHPSDARTGPQLFAAADDARASLADCLRRSRRAHHLRLIREHLLFPDGARLMDRPVAYRGGPQIDFPARRIVVLLRPRNRPHVCPRASALRRGDGRARRSRCAFGRARNRQPDRRRRTARRRRCPRQRNAFFSSTDAAFPDRYAAQRRMGARQGRCKSGSRAAGASIPAAQASIPAF